MSNQQQQQQQQHHHHHKDLAYYAEENNNAAVEQPDSAVDDYGYGDAAAPESADKYYGYEQADVPESTDKYGYGKAEPDYGYGKAEPDEVDYGYGTAEPDHVNSGDAYEYTQSLNDDDDNVGGARKQPFCRRTPPGRTASNESMASVATADSYGEYEAFGMHRRQRYRRRGSVTKYSIEAQQEVTQVQEEFHAHSNIIDQFRNQCAVIGVSDDVSAQPSGMDEQQQQLQSYHHHHTSNDDTSHIPGHDTDTDTTNDTPYVVADTSAVVGSLRPQSKDVSISPLQQQQHTDDSIKKKKKKRFKNLRRRFSIR